MKPIKHFVLFIFGLSLLSVVADDTYQGEIPEGIIIALKNGNSAGLSKYFNTNVELTLNDIEGIYSKGQAELIIRDFFSKHVPNNFIILHKGGKEGSRYGIGNLATADGEFRVTMLIKLNNSQPYIHQLRIEKEDEQ